LRRNCLLQGVIEGKKKEGDRSDRKTRKKHVGSYWMTLRKGEDSLI
jgi:hypothetical protein